MSISLPRRNYFFQIARITRCFVLMIAAAPALASQHAEDFAVFGGTGVTFQGGSTDTGNIGSNADITHVTNNLTVPGIQALGSFTGTDATQNVTGPVIANDGVSSGQFSVLNSVDSGGTVTLQGSSVNTVTATGDVSTSTFFKINQSVTAGGNIMLAASNTANTVAANGNVVTGSFTKINSVTYGGTFTPGVVNTIGSQTHAPVTATPAVAPSILIPAAASFTAGVTNIVLPINTSQTLAPGSYGSLTFDGSNTVSLSSGNYYFSNIASNADFNSFSFDLTSGPVNIFVAGDVHLLGVGETINGQTTANADRSLASQVLLESLGNVTLDDDKPANGSNMFGTIFAPDGAIQAGENERFTGSLLAGQSITLGANTNVDFVPSAALPEPAVLTLAILFLLLLRRGRDGTHQF